VASMEKAISLRGETRSASQPPGKITHESRSPENAHQHAELGVGNPQRFLEGEIIDFPEKGKR